jgi:WD40 repeat protein
MQPTRLELTALTALLLGLGVAAQTPDAPPKPAADPRAARTDLYEDPLPSGALARMGTARWRHGDLITFAAFLPDGKTIVTGGPDDVVRLWDSATGREVRRIRHEARDRGEGGPGGMMVFNNGQKTGLGVALSADGKTLATSGPDTSIRIWETATGKELHSLAAGQQGAASMAFTPDGKNLLSLSMNSTAVVVWDLATGKKVRTIEEKDHKNMVFWGGNGSANQLSISPDGKTVASVSLELEGNMVITVVNFSELETGKSIRKIKEKAGGIGWMSPTFSPDGKLIGWETYEGVVKLFDAAKGDEVRQIKSENRGYLQFAFAPDGKTLVTRHITDQVVKVWEVATGKEVRTLAKAPRERPLVGYAYSPGKLALSPDGKTLVVAGGQHALRLLDMETGEERKPAVGHTAAVAALCYSADGKALQTRAQDGTHRAWESATGKELRKLSAPEGALRFLVSPDERLVAATQPDNSVRLLHAGTNKEIVKIAGDPNNMVGCAFSPDGKVLALRGLSDLKMRLFDTAEGKELRTIELPAPEVPPNIGVGFGGPPPNSPSWPGLVFSPDGKTLALPLTRNRFGLYEVATGRELIKFELGEKELSRTAVFAPDGRSLAVGLDDGTVRLFEAATGKERRRYVPGSAPKPVNNNGFVNYYDFTGWYNGASCNLAFAPDGRLLAQGGKDRVVRLWDVFSGKEVQGFEGHQGEVQAVCFAPDGKALASASSDTTALVWDLADVLKRRPAAVELPAAVLAARWNDLAEGDGVKAFEAVGVLASSPAQAVGYLGERVRPAAVVEAKTVEKLVADLDSDEFEVRQKAVEELAKLGDRAVPALQKVLEDKPSPETRKRIEELLELSRGHVLSGDTLRELRALEVLERVGTAEARGVLRELAKGAPGARLTRTARAALERLER